MGSSGSIILIAAMIALGLSIWGLFNRGRSILCAFAGALVMVAASLGAMHAWGESRSIPWVAAYSIIALIGLSCLVRQVIPGEPEVQKTVDADTEHGATEDEHAAGR